jgi:hypothetical protein
MTKPVDSGCQHARRSRHNGQNEAAMVRLSLKDKSDLKDGPLTLRRSPGLAGR